MSELENSFTSPNWKNNFHYYFKKNQIPDKTWKSGLNRCVSTTWHKHKTHEGTHDRSANHMLANRAHQESVVHLHGLQVQFYYAIGMSPNV